MFGLLTELLLVITVAGLVAVVIVALGDSTGTRRVAGQAPALETRSSRWRAAHHSDGATTVVSVELVTVDRQGAEQVLERRRVAAVPDDAEDYELRFSAAMAQARVRAEVLQAESED